MAVMTDLPTEEPILRLTDEARQLVMGLRAEEPNAEELALWVEISGVSGGTFGYDVYFQATADAGPNDAVIAHDDVSVVIPAASVALSLAWFLRYVDSSRCHRQSRIVARASREQA